jgi:prepilin peptidase CpaA
VPHNGGAPATGPPNRDARPVTIPVAIALIALSVTAAWWDIRHRRIPNWLTLSGLALGLILHAAAGPEAVTAGVIGAGIGFGLALPLFALGGLGGGDVKLLAAVGAFLGPGLLLLAMLVMALVGGLMALITVTRHHAGRKTLLNLRTILASGFSPDRDGKNLVLPTLQGPDALTIPYGVAIAFGATAGAIVMLGGLA